MKRGLLFLISLLLLAIIVWGQEISRQEADSMIIALNKTKAATNRMELLLNLAQFHIFKVGENKIDLDSAAVYIGQAKALSNTINSPDANGYLLLTESYLIKERGEKAAASSTFTSEESKKMAEKAISVLESGNNKDYLGKAYYELSMYYNYDDSLETLKKIQLVRQSADAFEDAGDMKGKGRSLEMLGDLYYIWGEKNKSIQTLRVALAVYNSINYPRLQGVYVLIGRFYYFEHDYPSALSYLLKALKTAKSTKDNSMQLCQINNYLGNLYNDIDREDMAAKYLNDALEIARKNKDENAIFSVVGNLSFLYDNLRQPEQMFRVLGFIPKKFFSSENVIYKLAINMDYCKAYMGIRQLDKARPYFDVMVRIADSELNHDDYYDYDLERRALVYMYAANFYFLSRRYVKAHYYLAKTNAITKHINYDYVQIRSLELFYKLDSAQGDFKSAFKHLREYKEKADSVFSERKVRQFQVMNVEYEVEMKEDSIKLKNKDIVLLTQKNSLQQENLKQASLIKNITVTGIILAFIIIGLLYRQYRQKQRSNQVITQKNEQLQNLLIEKEWLVKEIHHRVKNHLQMVISLLNVQTEFLNNPAAINAIKESRERMQAIAIIHQKLYAVDNTTDVNMRSYINELVENIKNSFADSEQIYFKLDVDEVRLDISQSVPLGLILNEAITNAVKYAYSKKEKGLIQVSLKHHDSYKVQLKVADNGKGLPDEFDAVHSNTLGLQLIKLFSEQLDGDLFFINKNGLEILLNFTSVEYRT